MSYVLFPTSFFSAFPLSYFCIQPHTHFLNSLMYFMDLQNTFIGIYFLAKYDTFVIVTQIMMLDKNGEVTFGSWVKAEVKKFYIKMVSERQC